MTENARSRVSNSRARKSRVPEGGSNCVGMRLCSRIWPVPSHRLPAGANAQGSFLLAGGEHGGHGRGDIAIGGRLVEAKPGEHSSAVFEFQQGEQDVLGS